MKIDIYQSIRDVGKYVSVPAGINIGEVKFPEHIDPDLLSLSKFKMGVEIDLLSAMVALDSREIIDQIINNGYAVHMATVRGS